MQYVVNIALRSSIFPGFNATLLFLQLHVLCPNSLEGVRVEQKESGSFGIVLPGFIGALVGLMLVVLFFMWGVMAAGTVWLSTDASLNQMFNLDSPIHKWFLFMFPADDLPKSYIDIPLGTSSFELKWIALPAAALGACYSVVLALGVFLTRSTRLELSNKLYAAFYALAIACWTVIYWTILPHHWLSFAIVLILIGGVVGIMGADMIED